jgi:hypothetical protein
MAWQMIQEREIQIEPCYKQLMNSEIKPINAQ